MREPINLEPLDISFADVLSLPDLGVSRVGGSQNGEVIVAAAISTVDQGTMPLYWLSEGRELTKEHLLALQAARKWANTAGMGVTAIGDVVVVLAYDQEAYGEKVECLSPEVSLGRLENAVEELHSPSDQRLVRDMRAYTAMSSYFASRQISAEFHKE